MKVLLVDDSSVIRHRLAEMLFDIEGVDIVGQAAGVGEALYLVQHTKPDLAIVDLGLPQGSGLDVLQRIKRNDPRTTVVILTNYTESNFKSACIAAGADFFFDKSYEFERVPPLLSLLAAVRSKEDMPRP